MFLKLINQTIINIILIIYLLTFENKFCSLILFGLVVSPIIYLDGIFIPSKPLLSHFAKVSLPLALLQQLARIIGFFILINPFNLFLQVLP
jgi:hypothetical protein